MKIPAQSTGVVSQFYSLWIICKSFIKISGWLVLLDWGLKESFARPVQLTCGANYIVLLFMALIYRVSNSYRNDIVVLEN